MVVLEVVGKAVFEGNSNAYTAVLLELLCQSSSHGWCLGGFGGRSSVDSLLVVAAVVEVCIDESVLLALCVDLALHFPSLYLSIHLLWLLIHREIQR